MKKYRKSIGIFLWLSIEAGGDKVGLVKKTTFRLKIDCNYVRVVREYL